MRILLATNHLSRWGGTEQWTYTMHQYLSREHEVHVFAFSGNSLFEAQEYLPTALYNLSIINHNTCMKKFTGDPRAGFKIFTSHGVIPALERAIPGADAYVGVSEETSDAMPFESQVIRNPIDTQRFQPERPVNETLENVLFLSTHQGPALEVIKQATAAMKLNLEVIGVKRQVSDVERLINQADLVIGLGRSAYEAMACNRNVVIFDYRGGDGFVDTENIWLYNQHNCSGRTRMKMFTPRELMGEFERYDPSLELRPYILREHDVAVVAERYLDIYKK